MKSGSMFRKRRKKPAVEKPTQMVCTYCGQPVAEITAGKTLVAGEREAKFRHVERPVGCRIGDPLFDGDVR